MRGYYKQTKTVAMTMAALALLLVAAAQARAGLITNGGFETGDFTGWTESGNFEATSVQMAGGNGGYSPHSGTYYAALGPVGSLGYLSQDISTTPGDTYALTYWLASNGSTPNEFQTQINGVTVFDQTDISSQPYTEYTFDFTGTGSDTIQFGFRNDPNYLALDDVSVDPVPSGPATAPEPSSLVLFGVGAAGLLGYVGLRRKMKPVPVA